MNITLLFPTATEASLFRRDGVKTLVSGVGLTATAHAATKVILEDRPDWLILAGVAGMYPHAALSVGDVVLVESEVEGDLGFFTPDGFTHLAHLPLAMDFARRHTLGCPHLPDAAPFPRARSLSLNAALAPFVDAREVEIENMEGAAFFHVCREEGVRFLELRAISNVVRPGHDDWDLEGSVRALTDGLHSLLDGLLGQR
ncbi:phosphorylase family protein [Crenobacter luteus]|uniref:Purine phosphorylase n=1 Tax=Crenobacter luteus TaxID=1452487 RepID=A0A161SJY2_9NEIS|nr:purine phosphorylase [Crenobacter luteus]KZE34470.1 purine phosphorylase [Crenobacter luteus]